MSTIRPSLLMLWFLQSAAPAFAQTAPVTATVVTTGEGVVRASPDRAFVTVTAESRASGPRDVQRKNAEAMSAIHDKLRSLGISPEAIRTTMVDLRQEFDFPNGRRVPRGYAAINSIEVRVDALDRLGELLDAVVGSGATSVGEIRFDVRDRGAREREAVRLAVQNARARADAAAEGAGRAIDKLVRIEEQGVSQPPMPRPLRTMAMADAAQAATPIAPGELEFRAQVTLTATLK